MSKFLIALLKVRTVNLAEIASAFSGSSKIESKYRRIQNFFANYPLEHNDIAKAIGQHLSLT